MPRRVFMGGLIAYRSNGCQLRPRGRVLLGMALILLIVALSALTGCSTLRFYQQAVGGQMRLLTARQDVDKLLARDDLDPALRAALLDSQTVLAFARDELALEPKGRYGSYVDLKRDFVVWNLVVAPVDSVQPLTWCFPVAGCVSYRGYFKEQLAQNTAADFSAADFDTYVGGVPAYSTLGWFDDPLLSSFIHWPRAARAELLFHELAHTKLYLSGDTEFNESFATYVADYALPMFMRNYEGVEEQRRTRAERARFNALLLKLRERLEADFAQITTDATLSAEQIRAQVLAVRVLRYSQAQACLVAVADEFVDDRWLKFFAKPPNMARLSLVGAYQRWVGAFRELHAESGTLPAFYTATEQLAEQDAEERLAELTRLSERSLQKSVQAESDDHYAQDIQCEALANHPADGHLAG